MLLLQLQGACCLCSHPWALCQPDVSQNPIPRIWALLQFFTGIDAGTHPVLQKADELPGGFVRSFQELCSVDHDGFYPTGLSLSRWIPGTASSLRKPPNPTSVMWATLSLAWKKDRPFQHYAQGTRCLLDGGLKMGEGRMLELYMWLWEASCYF